MFGTGACHIEHVGVSLGTLASRVVASNGVRQAPSFGSGISSGLTLELWLMPNFSMPSPLRRKHAILALNGGKPDDPCSAGGFALVQTDDG